MAAITLPYDLAMYTGPSYAAIVGTTAITNPAACVKFGTNQGEVVVTAGAGELLAPGHPPNRFIFVLPRIRQLRLASET